MDRGGEGGDAACEAPAASGGEPRGGGGGCCCSMCGGAFRASLRGEVWCGACARTWAHVWWSGRRAHACARRGVIDALLEQVVGEALG